MSNKPYKQLNLEERIEIYRRWEEGMSMRRIAEVSGRNVGTISRELKRNRGYLTKEYHPVKAEELSKIRQKNQRTHAPLKNLVIFTYVRKKLREEHWSPETIAGRLEEDHPGESISLETIYQYIYGKGKKYHLWEHLTHMRKKRKRIYNRGVQREKKHSRIPDAISVDKRPTKANNRTQPGHWETDLMEGTRTEKAVLNVTVERKTRYTVLTKLINKQAKTKEKVLQKTLETVQSLEKSVIPIVRSITSDNGSENTNHSEVSENLKSSWYFCAPYHSWEKGSVENMIGRIRRDIPKKTPLTQYTKEQIQWLENKLNNTPRKCLDWKTPNEVFARSVNYYKFKRYQNLKESYCCTS